MSKNLITGGIGSLGCYLARNLIEAGEEVIIVDLRVSSKLIDDIASELKIVQADFTQESSIREIIKNNSIDCIYHLGAIQPQVGSEEQLLKTFNVNTVGTVKILEAALELNVETVIFTSTQGTYANYKHEVNENAPQRPIDMYSVTKVCCELLGVQYHRSRGLNFRCLRLPPLPGIGRNSFGHSEFCDLAVILPVLGREYVFKVGRDSKIPSVLYLKDAARALINLKEAEEDKLTRRIYNASALSFTAGELADTVRRFLPGAMFQFNPEKEMVSLLKAWPKMDSSRAKEDWGFNPEFTSLESYVEDLIREVEIDFERAEPENYR